MQNFSIKLQKRKGRNKNRDNRKGGLAPAQTVKTAYHIFKYKSIKITSVETAERKVNWHERNIFIADAAGTTIDILVSATNIGRKLKIIYN